MAKTTVERLRLLGTEFVAMEGNSLELFIDDAYDEIIYEKVPERYEEKLNRYLAAHLAVMRTKNIKSEAVSSLKREYFEPKGDDGLMSTVFGQEYARLLKELKGGSGLGLVVI